MIRFKDGVIVVVAMLMSSCGGGGGDGSPTPPPPPPPPPVTVTVAPADVSVNTGSTQQFTCTVTGVTNTACTWSIQQGTQGGTITASGLYTAPAAAGTFQVIAAAAADPTKTAMATVRVTTSSAQRQPWVTGYYAGWFWDNTPPAEVDMTAMTHLVFGRVAPGSGGLGGNPGEVILGAGTAHQVGAGGPDPARSVEDYLIARAHASNAKALLMIGGVGDGAGFLRSTSDAVRPTFVRNLLNYLVAHDYDGLDLDWEDELGNNSLGIPAQETYRRLIALIRDLRAAANAHPRYQGAGREFLITFPGYAKNLNINQVQPWEVEVASLVDQFNLMSYGIGTAADADGWVSWFSGPIFDSAANRPVDLASSIQAFVNAGVPRSKLGIGIGFYGMYYGMPDNTAAPTVRGPRQALNGSRLYADDVALSYRSLVELGYLNNGTYVFDDAARVGYRTYSAAQYPTGYRPTIAPHNGRSGAGFLSYEDERSIAAKGQWVRETGVGGTIIWVINYGYVPTYNPNAPGGRNPLLAATKCAFLLRGCP